MISLLLALVIGAQATAAQSAATFAYVPQRVFDTTRKDFSDFEAMVADLARADVVFLGEQHDDPNTHRLEAAILQGLQRRTVPVTLSLEMFERDMQTSLDGYLAGTLTEDQFLKGARPWPRYATDYRPLVEMARAHGWKVIAANVPRRYASEVAKTGAGAVDKLPPAERSYAARELQCPRDAYFDRFAVSMAEHPDDASKKATPEERRARTERYYDSQCVKDETMAESIAGASARGLVVHVNGAFHSDFGFGTADRVRRRLPGRKVMVVSILPVADLDALTPAGDDLRRADYLLYTLKPLP